MASRHRGVDDEDPVTGRIGDVVDPVSGTRFDYWKGPEWQYMGCYEWRSGGIPESDRYHRNEIKSLGQCYDWAVERRCLIWGGGQGGSCALNACGEGRFPGDAIKSDPTGFDYYFGLKEGDDWKNRYETASATHLAKATENPEGSDNQCPSSQTWGGMTNERGIWGYNGGQAVYLRVSLPADTAVDNHIRYWDLEQSFFEVVGTEGRWTVATNYTHCSWVKWATTDKEYHTLWFGSTSKYGSLNSYFLPRANERRRGVKSYGLGVPLVQGSLNGAFNNQQDQLQFLEPAAFASQQRRRIQLVTGLEWQYNRRRAKVDKSRWNFVCTVGYETSTGSAKSVFYMNLYPDFSHGAEWDDLVSKSVLTFDDFGALFPISEFDWAMIEPGAEVMRIGNAAQEPGKLAMYKSWNRAFSYEELRDEFAKTAVDITA